MTLDGELFGGRGQFQSTVKIVKTAGCEDYKKLKYHVSSFSFYFWVCVLVCVYVCGGWGGGGRGGGGDKHVYDALSGIIRCHIKKTNPSEMD